MTASNRALLTLRDQLLPQTIGKVSGASYAVTGQTAGSYDWNQMMKSSLPLVFGFVLRFAFLQPNGAIAPWLPMFLFVIRSGLSLDHHVFILSRMREAHDRGMSSGDAVANGINTTAGIGTSAALVMVGAFSIFATLPILDMKEFGVGPATAVLIDATIVRGVLLPASMKLLGERNWYLPNSLRWLPELERHTEPRIEPMPVAAWPHQPTIAIAPWPPSDSRGPLVI